MVKYTFTSKGSSGFPEKLLGKQAISDALKESGFEPDVIGALYFIPDNSGAVRGIMVMSHDTPLTQLAAEFISNQLIDNMLSYRLDIDYLEHVAA